MLTCAGHPPVCLCVCACMHADKILHFINTFVIIIIKQKISSLCSHRIMVSCICVCDFSENHIYDGRAAGVAVNEGGQGFIFGQSSSS